MKPCRPLRQGDQMQCHCGLAWDTGEEKPKCVNDKREIIEQLPLIETEPKKGKPDCYYCDGSGWFYGDSDLGACFCITEERKDDVASCSQVSDLVQKQNQKHHEVSNSPCGDAPYHSFANNQCIHCGVTRLSLLNEDGSRSIFDDVDE